MTDTAKHTPGPWKLETKLLPNCKTTVSARFVARGDAFADDEIFTIPSISEANAKLIAAAPDMAEALSDCDWLLRNLHAKTNSLEAQKEIMQCAETIRDTLAKAGVK